MSAESKSPTQQGSPAESKPATREPYKSPYSALYGGFEENREVTSGNTSNFQQNYSTNATNVNTQTNQVVNTPQDTNIKPFTSILPSMIQMNKANMSAIAASTIPSNQHQHNHQAFDTQTDPLKRIRLQNQFHSLVRKNYEVLPSEFRSNYKIVNYIGNGSTFALFLYFFTKASNKEQNNFRQLAFRFILMFGALTVTFGIWEDSIIKASFNHKFVGMSNEQIEKSIEEYKDTIPLLKL